MVSTSTLRGEIKMVRRRNWTHTEEKILVKNYKEKTIKELMELLPKRDALSINCKIHRLKGVDKIDSNKDKETVQRAYYQR